MPAPATSGWPNMRRARMPTWDRRSKSDGLQQRYEGIALYPIRMQYFRVRLSAGARCITPGLSPNSPSKSDGLAKPYQGSMQRNGAPPSFDQIPSSQNPSQRTSIDGPRSAAKRTDVLT